MIRVLMCGSSLEMKGGMVSVVKNYLEYNNWDNIKVTYLPTHTEPCKFRMVLLFICSFIKIVFLSILKKIDVAHLHTAERGSFYRKGIIVLYLHFMGVKTVMHHHAAEFEKFYDSLSSRKKSFVKRVLESVDVNLVLSESLVSMIKDKALNARVEVLYNAVNTYDTNLYDVNNNFVLFLGRLGERKGVYDLLESIKRIDTHISSDVKFLLCGDGEVDIVSQKVRKMNISHRIAHIGWIDGTEKQKYLKKTMLNILPSYNEGLPMTILETMALGIPNISTNIASIPEVVWSGVNGELIEPGDIVSLCEKLVMLVSDKNMRSRYSQNAYSLITNKFSLSNNISRLKEIYKSLLVA